MLHEQSARSLPFLATTSSAQHFQTAVLQPEKSDDSRSLLRITREDKTCQVKLLGYQLHISRKPSKSAHLVGIFHSPIIDPCTVFYNMDYSVYPLLWVENFIVAHIIIHHFSVKPPSTATFA